jgi:hypothetical protein
MGHIYDAVAIADGAKEWIGWNNSVKLTEQL